MVKLTSVQFALMRTFGYRNRKKYNHRVPLRYQRFQNNIDPNEIVAHYSREDLDKFNPYENERTFKVAQQTMGRKNFLLPNLSSQDLEINEIFQQEFDRQRAILARIDKIRVAIDSNPGKDTELMMNKNISTPFDCARHVHELLTTRTVVAEISPLETSPISKDSLETDSAGSNELVDSDENKLVVKGPSSIYWDMHRPIEDSCRIKFRHFAEKDVGELNKIYWRSCAFVLGMAIRLAFKEEVKVLLHSWPKPNVKSGSFVYDAALSLSNLWKPGEQELRAFTKVLWNIKALALPFDRLQVDREVARKLFASNVFKLSQIDSIIKNESSQGKVTVYRCGGLLDISIGPMISNTSQIGRITLAAVHPFESDSDDCKGVFYRFQGVSLPQQLPLSSYLYQNVLINNAKKLNKISL